MPEPGVEPSIRGHLRVLRRGRRWAAACGGDQPYVLPGNGAATRNGHARQNGNSLPSGQPGRRDN
jgi:hypothetical protein